jgi:hypothetical protein
LTVRRNFIDMPIETEGNSAIIAAPIFGAVTDWLVEENYLNGGNYTLFFRSNDEGDPEDILIRNNLVGRDYRYGIVSTDGSGVEVAENFWADTGEPVD